MLALPGLAIGPVKSSAAVGVVAVVVVKLGAQDPAPERFSLGHGIDNGRIGIQLHADAEPVAINPCDHWPFRCLASLFRRSRRASRLVRSSRSGRPCPLGPQLFERLGHRRLHPCDDCRPARLSSRSCPEARALGNQRGRTGQVRDRGELLADDDRRHSFGDGDQPLDGLAVLQQVQNGCTARPVGIRNFQPGSDRRSRTASP